MCELLSLARGVFLRGFLRLINSACWSLQLGLGLRVDLRVGCGTARAPHVVAGELVLELALLLRPIVTFSNVNRNEFRIELRSTPLAPETRRRCNTTARPATNKQQTARMSPKQISHLDRFQLECIGAVVTDSIEHCDKRQ